MRIADELSTASQAAYRQLVYETPGFVDWFRAITPVVELSTMNIGSRPASRTNSGRIEDLRAIPWVFSWSQCRLMLPGWFGVGTAVAEWVGDDQARLAELAVRCTNSGRGFAPSCPTWPRCWRSPTSRSPPATRPLRATCHGAEEFFDVVAAEHAKAVWTAQVVSGHEDLLYDNPALARGVRYRIPYIAPLNHMQVSLLRRWRGGDQTELMQRGIHLAINGVATGLRNSG